MEIQELYTSFLPKKVKNDARSYPAPSSIYLSSNKQQLKLLRIEKEIKKLNSTGDKSFKSNSRRTQELQTPKARLKDDFKRSQSFNQSPNKNTDFCSGISSRNQSIPFEQYMCQQLVIRNLKLNEENTLANNPFSNSLLSQINNKQENQLVQQYNNNQTMNKLSSRRVSGLTSDKLYQKSIVILNKNESKIKDPNLSFRQIQKAQQANFSVLKDQGDFDISVRFKDEDNLYKNSKQFNSIQREYDNIKILEKKCKDSSNKCPINICLQKINHQQQINNIYDRYYPHYQTSIKMPIDINPEKKLEEVMGGKMKSFIPSELKNLDPQQHINEAQRRQIFLQTLNHKNQINKNNIKSIYNSELIQDSLYNTQYQNYYDIRNPDIKNNQLNLPSQPYSRQNIQKRGQSSNLSSRPSRTINQPQSPISSKIIKPALSIQAHMNKDNVVITSQQQTTVNGEIQKYVIPLQQNYCVELNEIDRIKARRKLLLSKRRGNSINEHQSFNQEDTKINFLNKVESTRQTPNNELEEQYNNQLKQKSTILKNIQNIDSLYH